MDSGGKNERDLFSVKRREPLKKLGKKKKRKEKYNEEQSEVAKHTIFDDADSGCIEPLTYQSLASGLLTLGCITKVTNYDLTVSLPHMISGKVAITRISNAYTALLKKVTESKDDLNDAEDQVLTLQSLFKIGQYVVTKVDSVEKEDARYKVNLCLVPQEVNFGVAASKMRVGLVLPCAVASVEDNGYAMETGIPNVRVAFLNRTQTEGSGITGVGSVARCLVTHVRKSEDGESVQLKLSAIPTEVNKASLDVTETDDYSLLIPGTAVNTTVSSIEKDSLKLIGSEEDSFISMYHLQTPLYSLKMYRVGQKVTARVLYITQHSRLVHLSLQDCIFSKSPDDLLHGYNLGDRKEGEVYEVLKKGIFFKLGKCRGFCSNKHLRDKETAYENNVSNFPLESRHMLRITSYHYFDQTFIVSLQKSVLNDQIVGLNEVKVGQVLKATIKSYDTQGALVRVARNVDGQIPFLHLTDTHVKHPEKKYAIGNTVNVRVLEVVPERKRLMLTCKKLLVNCKESIVSEYSKDVENSFTRGFVVQIQRMGLLVSFYNGVKGFIAKSETAAKKESDLSKVFSLGDVLKCRILSVNPETKRITASLILNKGDSLQNKTIKSIKELHVRRMVNCVVKKVKENSIMVRIKPSNLKAEIPVYHLADDLTKCEELKKIICNGDQIHNVTVFRIAETIVLSMKDSLCSWILKNKSEPLDYLRVSSCYMAVITNIVPEGQVVSIPVGTFGQGFLIQSKVLKDAESLDTDTSKGKMKVGQSIQVKCLSIGKRDCPDLSAKRISPMKKRSESLQLLYSHLKYEMVLQNGLLRKGLLNEEFGGLNMGDKLEMVVVSVTPRGLLVKTENNNISGIVLQEHLQPNTDYEIGKRLPVCVLHVDFKEKHVVLTAKSDLVKQLHVEESPSVRIGQKVRSEVLFIQKEFALLRLKSRCKGLMVYAPVKKNLNVGQSVTVTIKHIEGKVVLTATKAQLNWGLLPICTDFPSIYLHSVSDIKEEYQTNDSMEEISVENVKEIPFYSIRETKKIHVYADMNVKENYIVKDKVRCDGKTNEKKSSSDEIILAVKELEDVKDTDGDEFVKKRRKLAPTDVVQDKTDGKKSVISKIEIATSEIECNEKGRKRKATIDGEIVKHQIKSAKKLKPESCNSRKEEADSGVDETMDLEDEFQDISSKPCLKVGTGFVWDVPEIEEKESDSSDDGEDKDEIKKKKTKRLSKVEREILAKEEEKRLHELECARLEKERLPQSALDYEELLQQSPNSSAIWIQFISFHLENAEVEKARSIAQRALQVMDVQEFEERINIWTVILRLEVLYGTEESTGTSFREALATNDPLKIYIAMAMVYAESNKLKEAEDTYYKMSKKFSNIFDVWIKAGIFFFKNGKLEEARRYMDRALLSLNRTHHVNLINRFGQLEFQFGEVERARTMFESLLSNYPKRMDIWIVYVDLLAKMGDIEGARQVLERMTSLKLRLRNMRSVFKKFLEFEKTYGTPHSVESVKNRVQDFVAASLKDD